MKRKLMNFGMVAIVSIGMYGCVNSAPPVSTPPPTTVVETPSASAEVVPSTSVEVTPSTQEFTVEELAKYNGKDGNKAYIAVDGTVYDVTELGGWKNGAHNGFEAGKDLTADANGTSGNGPTEKPANMPKDIPNLTTVLSRAKVVGTLKTTELKVFTVEELAKYNGKDGNKAYIAVNGTVYDVTDLYGWQNGAHNGFEAGKDLTADANGTSGNGPTEKPANMPKDIPSLETVLGRAKIVGTLKATN